MFVLVTQSDGSARRFPFVSLAVAALLVYSFTAEDTRPGSIERASALRSHAAAYFEEHPFVMVDPSYHSILPPSFTEPRREAYTEERRQQGLPLLRGSLVRHNQEELDELLHGTDRALAELPAWRHGISGGEPAGAQLFSHIRVHEVRAALILCLVILLCAGIPLEDGWGHIIYGLFVVGAIAATGAASSAFDYTLQSGLPWFGASGLAAAILGAYFIRSLRGSARLIGVFPMSGWAMLPIWIGIEYLMIREMTSEQSFVRSVAMVHGAGFGLGAFVSASIWALGIERRQIDRKIETVELVSNKSLEEAMTLREKGKQDEAFELLRNEFRRARGDVDIALAFWDSALEVGKPAHAIEAITRVIRTDLDSGLTDRAVKNYMAASTLVDELGVDGELAVRLGEALFDEGHPEIALQVFSEAVNGERPLSAALCQRVLGVARDLDPELTERAAAVALLDPRVAPAEREKLAALSGGMVAQTGAPRAPAALPPSQAPAPTPAPVRAPAAAPAPNPAPAPITSNEAPESAGPDLELDAPAAASQSWDDDQDLDPQALNLDALSEDAVASPDTDSDAALESWNVPGLVEDVEDEIEEEFADLGGMDDLADLGDFDDLDTADIEAAARDAGLMSSAQGQDTTATLSVRVQGDGETITEIEVPAAEEDAATVVNLDPAAAAAKGASLRELMIRTGTPIRLESDALVIEIDGGKKTRLPYERIDAVAAGAVHGISDKPVLIVDVVLNWARAEEPVKLIRMQSDRFDPRSLMEGSTSPLEALRGMLARMLSDSGATPLASLEAATGTPFNAYPDLVSYQRDVLNAS